MKINLRNDFVEEIREQKLPETKHSRADSSTNQQAGIVAAYEAAEKKRKTPVKTPF